MFPLFRNTEVHPYVRTLRTAISYILMLTSGDTPGNFIPAPCEAWNDLCAALDLASLWHCHLYLQVQFPDK